MVRGSYRKSWATFFFLHANREQQTKESVVVDGTSCCVILECLATSIACITWPISLLTKWPTTVCRFASVLSSNFSLKRKSLLQKLTRDFVYVIQVCWQLASGIRPEPARKLSANLCDIYHCCLQWRTRDGGQRNCPKHVEFYSQNKFEKLVHLVGFIIRIFHDARSPERPKILLLYL